METAIIADIQRFSLHDGPGIRTTVFLKGCNMRCLWCHNPEAIAFEPEILLDMAKCIKCGYCDEGCFAGARELCGQEMSLDEVMAHLMLDAPYYGEYGGLTLSGGEPTCQAGFCTSLLQACRDRGINTAVETNLHTDDLTPLLSAVDLIMADMKLFDDELHRKWTGVGNKLIKKNIVHISALGIPLILRTPVIPGVNATVVEIEAIASFANELPSLRYYELLPYHSLGFSKGKAQSRTYTNFEKPDANLMRSLGEAAARRCINVRVAGQKLTGTEAKDDV